MTIKHKNSELFAFDYIFKKDGSIDVLICAPGFEKGWLNIPRSAVIDNSPLEDGKEHYE